MSLQKKKARDEEYESEGLWYKGEGDPTSQDMRERCVQSKDVSSKQPVDGITCRAWSNCRRARWAIAPCREEWGEGAVILRKVWSEARVVLWKRAVEKKRERQRDRESDASAYAQNKTATPNPNHPNSNPNKTTPSPEPLTKQRTTLEKEILAKQKQMV
jgi:hypothetical protein